jgi:hypothetical protein
LKIFCKLLSKTKHSLEREGEGRGGEVRGWEGRGGEERRKEETSLASSD